MPGIDYEYRYISTQYLKILSGWKLFICYYMLYNYGKVKMFLSIQHIAIKIYNTSEQNLIKIPKYLQHNTILTKYPKKKTKLFVYFLAFLLSNSIKNAKPYVTNQI